MKKYNAETLLHTKKHTGCIYLLALHIFLFSPASIAQTNSAPAAKTSKTANEITYPIRAFRLTGNRLIPTEHLLDKLAVLYGENRSVSDLATARDLVLAVYKQAGYSLIGVGLPTRIATDGVVELSITEITVGKVQSVGNQHFSFSNLREQLPVLVEGLPPNTTKLSNEIFLANDNPSRYLSVNFTPPKQGSVDAEIRVTETEPLSYLLSADSSGSAETGRARLGLAVQHANMFERSHILKLGYRTSPANPDNVKVANFAYQIPQPAFSSQFQISAYYADVNVGRVLDAFEVSGKFTHAELAYLVDVQRDLGSRHALEFALAKRDYQPSILFGGANLVTDVSAVPASAGYRYASENIDHKLALDLTYTHNLAVGSKNDNATYNASRATASASWQKLRLSASGQRELGGDWSARLRGTVQYADAPLIDTEALFAGGLNSVRGLVGGELMGDRGYFANLELYAPKLADAHRFFVFVDSGKISRINAQPGEQSGSSALTGGVGWSYVRSKKAELTVGIANVVEGATLTPGGKNALDFRALIRF